MNRRTRIICSVGSVLLLFFLGFMYTTTSRTNQYVDPPQPSDITPAPEVAPQDLSEHIVVDSPQQNDYITSPVTITGTARGPWYFEASFPVVLVDWDGKIIAQGHAQAQGEWMTEDFVPFTATLSFEKPVYGDRGALILKNDNPSGLPERDRALEIPIFFK